MQVKKLLKLKKFTVFTDFNAFEAFTALKSFNAVTAITTFTEVDFFKAFNGKYSKVNENYEKNNAMILNSFRAEQRSTS